MANPVKCQVRVVSIDRVGSGIDIVKLSSTKRLPQYRAGQFLHLTVDSFDEFGGFWPESRVFSIASRFDERHITIIYSVKGRYTQRIRDELAVGREVWIKLPYGEFIVENHLGEDGREAVIVAGGTGISPFLPLIEGIVDQERDPIRMQLYYGIREFGSILSRDLLIALNRFPECSVHLFVEQGIDESLGLRQEIGILDVEFVVDGAAQFRHPVYFLSGPPQMLHTFKNGLALHGIFNEDIIIDEWE